MVKYKPENAKLCRYCRSVYIPEVPGQPKCDSTHEYICPICHNKSDDDTARKFYRLANLKPKSGTDPTPQINTLTPSNTKITVSSVVYTGAPLYPSVTVVYNQTQTLVEGKQYVLEFSDNVDPGTGTVTVIGIKKFTGTLSKTFTIQKAKLSDCHIQKIPDQLSLSDPYTKIEIKPKVHIHLGSRVLVQNQDYTVEYLNNEDVGTGSVNITAIGNYVTGEDSITFEIVPEDVFENVIVYPIPDQIYTGRVIKPEPMVLFKGYLATKGVDYQLRYLNHTNLGTARIEITSLNSTLPSGEPISWSVPVIATFRIVKTIVD